MIEKIDHNASAAIAGHEPCVATIGFFDGVHRGHRFLIDHVREEAARCGLGSMVVTLDRHPRQVLQQEYQPEMITTASQKLQLLEATGVDNVAVLHFDKQTAALSARDFMSEILRSRLNVRKLIIGYDNRFGHRSADNPNEGFADYVEYGKELGIDVIHNPVYEIHGVKVSSSVVRSFIKEGEVEMAGVCLGRPYSIGGTVVTGYQEGRKLGFPTANIDAQACGLLIPKCGVYAVEALTEGDTAWRPAMMDIGMRPTFDGHRLSLEVNIFDFQGDLYGRQLHVRFVKRVRDEKKFRGVATLVEQLKKDEALIREILR